MNEQKEKMLDLAFQLETMATDLMGVIYRVDVNLIDGQIDVFMSHGAFIQAFGTEHTMKKMAGGSAKLSKMVDGVKFFAYDVMRGAKE